MGHGTIPQSNRTAELRGSQAVKAGRLLSSQCRSFPRADYTIDLNNRYPELPKAALCSIDHFRRRGSAPCHCDRPYRAPKCRAVGSLKRTAGQCGQDAAERRDLTPSPGAVLTHAPRLPFPVRKHWSIGRKAQRNRGSALRLSTKWFILSRVRQKGGSRPILRLGFATSTFLIGCVAPSSQNLAFLRPVLNSSIRGAKLTIAADHNQQGDHMYASKLAFLALLGFGGAIPAMAQDADFCTTLLRTGIYDTEAFASSRTRYDMTKYWMCHTHSDKGKESTGFTFFIPPVGVSVTNDEMKDVFDQICTSEFEEQYANDSFNRSIRRVSPALAQTLLACANNARPGLRFWAETTSDKKRVIVHALYKAPDDFPHATALLDGDVQFSDSNMGVNSIAAGCTRQKPAARLLPLRLDSREKRFDCPAPPGESTVVLTLKTKDKSDLTIEVHGYDEPPMPEIAMATFDRPLSLTTGTIKAIAEGCNAEVAAGETLRIKITNALPNLRTVQFVCPDCSEAYRHFPKAAADNHLDMFDLRPPNGLQTSLMVSYAGSDPAKRPLATWSKNAGCESANLSFRGDSGLVIEFEPPATKGTIAAAPNPVR